MQVFSGYMATRVFEHQQASQDSTCAMKWS